MSNRPILKQVPRELQLTFQNATAEQLFANFGNDSDTRRRLFEAINVNPKSQAHNIKGVLPNATHIEGHISSKKGEVVREFLLPSGDLASSMMHLDPFVKGLSPETISWIFDSRTTPLSRSLNVLKFADLRSKVIGSQVTQGTAALMLCDNHQRTGGVNADLTIPQQVKNVVAALINELKQVETLDFKHIGSGRENTIPDVDTQCQMFRVLLSELLNTHVDTIEEKDLRRFKLSSDLYSRRLAFTMPEDNILTPFVDTEKTLDELVRTYAMLRGSEGQSLIGTILYNEKGERISPGTAQMLQLRNHAKNVRKDHNNNSSWPRIYQQELLLGEAFKRPYQHEHSRFAITEVEEQDRVTQFHTGIVSTLMQSMNDLAIDSRSKKERGANQELEDIRRSIKDGVLLALLMVELRLMIAHAFNPHTYLEDLKIALEPEDEKYDAISIGRAFYTGHVEMSRFANMYTHLKAAVRITTGAFNKTN